MFCRAQELASLSQTFLRFEYMYITMSPNLFSFRVLFFQHHFECFSWWFTLRDRGICVSDLKIINVLRFGVATQEAASDSKQEPWAPAQNQSVVYYIFVAWLDFFLLRIIFIPFRVTFFRQSEFDTWFAISVTSSIEMKHVYHVFMSQSPRQKQLDTWLG